MRWTIFKCTKIEMNEVFLFGCLYFVLNFVSLAHVVVCVCLCFSVHSSKINNLFVAFESTSRIFFAGKANRKTHQFQSDFVDAHETHFNSSRCFWQLQFGPNHKKKVKWNEKKKNRKRKRRRTSLKWIKIASHLLFRFFASKIMMAIN